ncbi:ABC transporter permease subunit [Ruania halotolerans]|uniref:ABC transporter permease subunit n=1 Tax=Ruania halotolerans TaxID=2897773 RepID=UPI001E5CC57B|nr:ABC transporter permease subunit [Ruania halotolerans]UFU05362.1 ABC transporter permease subunit [Ruania halotolerans]
MTSTPRHRSVPRRSRWPISASARARPGVTFARVLAAEWTKLLSLRSTVWTAVGTIVAAALLAYALGLFVRPGDAQSGASLIVSGYLLAQLGTLVLGVQVGTGEYSTGTFKATFTAIPRRVPVLVAQVVVTIIAALGTAAAALVASFLVTIGLRAGHGLTVDLTDGETVRLMSGFAVYLTGVALVGLGIGALLRRPSAALVSGVMVLIVIDHLLAVNPGLITDTVRALLPGSGARLLIDDAGLTALDATSLGPHLSAWGGGAVLGAWVLALLVAGGYRLRRHDLT